MMSSTVGMTSSAAEKPSYDPGARPGTWINSGMCTSFFVEGREFPRGVGVAVEVEFAIRSLSKVHLAK